MAGRSRGIQFQGEEGADREKDKKFERRQTQRFPQQTSRISVLSSLSGLSRESQASSASLSERVRRRPRMSLFGGRRSHIFTSGSTMIERRPSMRFEPTFRMDSRYSFHREYVELMLRSHLERNFENYTYTAKGADKKCQRATISLLTRVKQLNFDRYRLVCVIMMGEKFYQGCQVKTGFLWDKTKDMWAYQVYETPSFYAIGVVYGVYYD